MLAQNPHEAIGIKIIYFETKMCDRLTRIRATMLP